MGFPNELVEGDLATTRTQYLVCEFPDAVDVDDLYFDSLGDDEDCIK